MDLEHFTLEMNRGSDEFFCRLTRESAHVHMTEYRHGSTSRHALIHHAQEQSWHFLNLLYTFGYHGFVVSEASTDYQMLEELKR